jgi:hypothetical protein
MLILSEGEMYDIRARKRELEKVMWYRQSKLVKSHDEFKEEVDGKISDIK